MKLSSSPVIGIFTRFLQLTLILVSLVPHIQGMTLIDVAPYDISIQNAYGLSEIILAENSVIPCRQTKTFTTIRDHQSQITLRFYAGSRRLASANYHLGTIDVRELASAKAGMVDIRVCAEADSKWKKVKVRVEIGAILGDAGLAADGAESEVVRELTFDLRTINPFGIFDPQGLADATIQDMEMLRRSAQDVDLLTGWTLSEYELERLDNAVAEDSWSTAARRPEENGVSGQMQVCSRLGWCREVNPAPVLWPKMHPDDDHNWSARREYERLKGVHRQQHECAVEDRAKEIVPVQYDIESGVVSNPSRLDSCMAIKRKIKAHRQKQSWLPWRRTLELKIPHWCYAPLL